MLPSGPIGSQNCSKHLEQYNSSTCTNHTGRAYQNQCSAHDDNYAAILTCIPWYQPGLHSYWKCANFWPGTLRPSYCSHLLPLCTATMTALKYYQYSRHRSPSQNRISYQQCVDPSTPTTPDKNLLWPP